MNGKPETQPSNHVEWANGFKSNMPDWPTARRCAHSEMMLRALKSARTLLHAMDVRIDGQRQEVEDKIFDLTFENICIAIDLADGLDGIVKAMSEIPHVPIPFHEENPYLKPMPPPPGFPKPPGVK